jgi:hypothetical protein
VIERRLLMAMDLKREKKTNICIGNFLYNYEISIFCYRNAHNRDISIKIQRFGYLVIREFSLIKFAGKLHSKMC